MSGMRGDMAAEKQRLIFEWFTNFGGENMQMFELLSLKT